MRIVIIIGFYPFLCSKGIIKFLKEQINNPILTRVLFKLVCLFVRFVCFPYIHLCGFSVFYMALTPGFTIHSSCT